jgi:hypothetical protein
MKEDYVRFETAKLAKEKGFNIHCIKTYNPETGAQDNSKDWKNIDAPAQALLQKWLREKHDIHVYCTPNRHFIARDFDSYSFSVLYVDTLIEDDGSYATYEEALEAGLVYALKIIK